MFRQLKTSRPNLPGEDSPAFKGVGLFLGVLVSLGSTSTVANVVAGIILTYTRGFRAGDWVKTGDNLGAVMAQAMLATHLVKTPAFPSSGPALGCCSVLR
jgi:hypothetical protein